MIHHHTDELIVSLSKIEQRLAEVHQLFNSTQALNEFAEEEYSEVFATFNAAYPTERAQAKKVFEQWIKGMQVAIVTREFLSTSVK